MPVAETVGPMSLFSVMGTLFLYQLTVGSGKPLGGSQYNSARVPTSTRNEVGEVTNCLRISVRHKRIITKGAKIKNRKDSLVEQTVGRTDRQTDERTDVMIKLQMTQRREFHQD